MKNFAIVQPFKLDWKYVAPYDYESLEFFITPSVSILLHNITNGKLPFHIGSYIMEDASKRTKFDNEVMPQRSKERITKSFNDEDVSVFFSLDDAKSLTVLFEEEGFICRRIEVLYEGRPVNVLELPEIEFNKLMKTFGELKVVATTDFDTQWENIAEQAEEIREDIAKGMRKEQAEREAKHIGVTKKNMTIRGIIGIGLVMISAASAGFSKMMFEKQTKGSILGGIGLAAISVVTGIFGKRLTTDMVEYAQRGLILNYG